MSHVLILSYCIAERLTRELESSKQKQRSLENESLQSRERIMLLEADLDKRTNHLQQVEQNAQQTQASVRKAISPPFNSLLLIRRLSHDSAWFLTTCPFDAIS